MSLKILLYELGKKNVVNWRSIHGNKNEQWFKESLMTNTVNAEPPGFHGSH